MNERRLELGLVEELDAESFGEPGNRTFRLLLTLPGAEVSVWLEKEQLVMLGAAIEELLLRVPPAAVSPEARGLGQEMTGDLELKPGSLAIGYLSDLQVYMLEATDFVSALAIDTLRFFTSRRQLENVRKQIEDINRGGRPRCPLCGRPITGEPHFCPESNGHSGES